VNPDLYASTRRSATAHNEQRTGERRLAVLASIRSARNLGRVCSVAAAVLGSAVAALLTGFGLWAPILSKASVIGCLMVSVCVAWGSAVLLVLSGVFLFVGLLSGWANSAAVSRA